MPETFLAASQQGCLVSCLDDDQPIGIEAGLRQSRREKIGTRNAPQHLARCSGCNAGSKQDGGSAVNRARCTARNFVK